MSDNFFEVTDEDTGIKLVYVYDSDYGWSFIASGYDDRETGRKAVHLSLKYWPEVPEQDRERVVENNVQILDVISSLHATEDCSICDCHRAYWKKCLYPQKYREGGCR